MLATSHTACLLSWNRKHSYPRGDLTNTLLHTQALPSPLSEVALAGLITVDITELRETSKLTWILIKTTIDMAFAGSVP